VLQRELTQDALRQQADEVAVVVQGVLGRHLTATSLTPAARPRARAWWGGLAQQLLLADPHLVRIKVWNTRGQVIYSNDPAQIGQSFPIDTNLRTALAGQRAMDVSDLSEAENADERRAHRTLLEVYIPIRAGSPTRTRVIGAYETYSDLGALNRRLDQARLTVWGSVGVGFVLLYA
jgi:hypothetical protein